MSFHVGHGVKEVGPEAAKVQIKSTVETAEALYSFCLYSTGRGRQSQMKMPWDFGWKKPR